MNRCVIFGGGDITDYNYVLTKINCTDYIICADSGYKHTVKLAIKPNLAVGDFDSMEQDMVDNCEVMACSPYKDDTDTMIAVKTALQKGYTEILLFGMLGGRFDHSIANLQTLRYIAEHGGTAWILDITAEITVIINGTVKLDGDEKYSLSVFSLNEQSKGVYLQNVAYPLQNATLTAGFPLGVSNGFLKGNAVITVAEGCLTVMKCLL